MSNFLFAVLIEQVQEDEKLRWLDRFGLLRLYHLRRLIIQKNKDSQLDATQYMLIALLQHSKYKEQLFTA